MKIDIVAKVCKIQRDPGHPVRSKRFALWNRLLEQDFGAVPAARHRPVCLDSVDAGPGLLAGPPPTSEASLTRRRWTWASSPSALTKELLIVKTLQSSFLFTEKQSQRVYQWHRNAQKVVDTNKTPSKSASNLQRQKSKKQKQKDLKMERKFKKKNKGRGRK